MSADTEGLEKAAVRFSNLSSDRRISQFVLEFTFQGYLTEDSAFLRRVNGAGLDTDAIRTAYPTVRDTFMLSLKSFSRLYKLELLTMYVDANVWVTLETIPTLRTLVLQNCTLSGNYAPCLKLDCFEARRFSFAGEELHLAHLDFPTIQHMVLDFSSVSQSEFTSFTHHAHLKNLTFPKLSTLQFTPPEKWIDVRKDESGMPSSARDFLRLFPNLEKLRFNGKSIPSSFTNVAIPLEIFPRLTSLSAPQNFASAFIPGRNIRDLKLQDPPSTGLLELLQAHAIERLRSLDVTFINPLMTLSQGSEIVHLMAHSAPMLERLHLSLPEADNSSDQLENSFEKRYDISSFAEYELDESDMSFCSFGDLLAAIVRQHPLGLLPPNLTHLELRRIPSSFQPFYPIHDEDFRAKLESLGISHLKLRNPREEKLIAVLTTEFETQT
ncbi:hypothetical protein BDP27DRAFT_1401753 [Rhodocollybia butyracea]|uniref:Uncharacterized protein n=1 Tax=Rhodocollybia butyracea TaxID=206335 RepID=A0A9P5PVN9_9AGAR|nr:hypothetical protein BDP27DRAFT_1401753 [Rhodocollybia butyracea]